MNRFVSPLFQDWLHTSARVFGDIPNFPPQKIEFPHPTTTTNCLIAIHIPQIVIPQQHGNCEASIHFWQNITDDSSDNHTEILNAVNSQYSQLFPRMRIHPRINPPSTWISQFFVKAKSRPPSQRVMVHYYSNGPPPQADMQAIQTIIEDPQTIQCTAFIFEYDKCGQMIDLFKSKPENDTYAFFACDSNQTLPRSSELPIDLFTSCMTTPARMALLWHSRHYYCFKNGPLKPLSPFFLEEDETDCPITDIFSNVQAVMRHTVEAMAFETMDRSTFIKMFRTDHVIAQLSVNFIFACHLFTFFNVTPISFPQFPSTLANHHLWQTFDLRLDAELFRLQQPQLPQSVSFTRYLEQVVTSLKTAVDVSPKETHFLPQLSYISSMITPTSPPQLITSACEALASFLDRNSNSVLSALHFPIVHSILPLLLSSKGNMNNGQNSPSSSPSLVANVKASMPGQLKAKSNPTLGQNQPFMHACSQALLFCLCKIFCYETIGREQIFDRTPYFFETIIFPLFPIPPAMQAPQKMFNQQPPINQNTSIPPPQYKFQIPQQNQVNQTQQNQQQMQLQLHMQQVNQINQVNQIPQSPINQQNQNQQKQQLDNLPQLQQSQINQQLNQVNQQLQLNQMPQSPIQQQQQNQLQLNQQQIQPRQNQFNQMQSPSLDPQQQNQAPQSPNNQLQQINKPQSTNSPQTINQHQQVLLNQQQLQTNRNKSATLPLMLTVLFIRNSPKILSSFVKTPWMHYIIPLLKSKNVDTRIWSLLVISLASQGITNDQILSSIYNEIKEMMKSNNTEERLCVVYCLTQFIIGFRSDLQHDIFSFIIECRKQSCFLIRCQVLSAISYFYQQFYSKFFLPDTELEMQAHDSLLELSDDPHPLVAETSSLIIDAITQKKDNLIYKSNVLDSFVSLILFPIGHILKSEEINDHPISFYAMQSKSSQNEPISQARNSQNLQTSKYRKIQNLLKLGPIYTHAHEVTSNFVYLPPKQLLFGDKDGYINIKNWNDANVTQSHKIISSPIMCMKYVENSSFPLLFSSTSRGFCLCHSFAYKEPIKLLSAFQLPCEHDQSYRKFDVDTVYGRLFSYEPHLSNHLSLFDLRSEIQMEDVMFADKFISSFHLVNQGTSMVAVCTDDQMFNLVDVRTKEAVISVNLCSKPFDFKVMDPTEPSFSVLMQGGVVEFFDLKNVEGTRRTSRINCSPPVEVASFDAEPDMLFCSIGHSNGLSLVDLMNQKATQFNSFQGWFGGRQTFGKVSQTLFASHGMSLSLLNGQNEIAVLLEGKEMD